MTSSKLQEIENRLSDYDATTVTLMQDRIYCLSRTTLLQQASFAISKVPSPLGIGSVYNNNPSGNKQREAVSPPPAIQILITDQNSSSSQSIQRYTTSSSASEPISSLRIASISSIGSPIKRNPLARNQTAISFSSILRNCGNAAGSIGKRPSVCSS